MTETENPKPAEAGVAIWKFAGAEFDELKWELRIAGEPVEMEPRPLEILLCLLRHAGETVTKDELLQSVWGHAYLSENALSNAIGKLRKALRDEQQSIIVTTYKMGYRLAVPVLRREPPNHQQARLGLKPGDSVPCRPGWLLKRELGVTRGSEVWLAAPVSCEAEQRVFKFSPDGSRLSSLKREAALSRLLQSALGQREDLVRVLDWSFDQPPFFIECEYGGSSLAQWAEAHGGISALPMSLRLDLLAQVSEAVAMAHSVGVLHKDLKPDNVLIQEDAQGLPRVRLIDFGSGALTDPASLQEWSISRVGIQHTAQGGSGTPMYMAPELSLGHAPTVQSDLYAIGVMLYQLAVGDLRRFLAAGWEREITDELMRQDIADAASGTPEHRLTSARELAERLRHVDQRRLQQHLAEEQKVTAQAARELLERSRVRRPWLIAAGAALTLGLLTSLWFFRQAVLSRDQERTEAAMMRAVNGFLNNDLLAAANPNLGGSMEISVRDAIARASGSIDSRFAKSPAFAVTLHQTVGSAYRTLGQYSDAEREFRSARSMAYSAFGASALVSQTCDLQLAQTLAYLNKFDEAQALLAPIDSRVWGKPDTDPDPMIRLRLWDVHNLLDGHRSNLLAAAADADRTQSALDDMRRDHPRVYAANQDFVFLVGLHISAAYERAGESRQAERIERGLVDQLSAARGAGDPLTIQAREKWLISLIRLGQTAEAVTLLPALQQDVAGVGGGDSPLRLELMRVQSALNAEQGKWAAAIQDSLAVERGYTRLFGVDNDASIVAMVEAAALLRAAGQSDAAVSKYLEAYGLARSSQGRDGLLTQSIAYPLAAACLDAQKSEQARLYLANLNPAALAAAAPGRDWNANLAYERGRLARQSGNEPEAQQEFAVALRFARQGGDQEFAARVEKSLDSAVPAAVGTAPLTNDHLKLSSRGHS